jgi:hypothetical protein
MKQGTDAEFRRNAIVYFADADENVGSGQHGHVRMANLVGLPARHDDPERSEGLLRQQVTKGLWRHGRHYAGRRSGSRSGPNGPLRGDVSASAGPDSWYATPESPSKGMAVKASI